VTRLTCALVMTLAAGCAESPAQGFEDFYAALVDGDARVLERLDAASRARVQQAAQARGLEPARALAGDGVRSTLRAVHERARTDTTATLDVEDALGKSEEVHMVLEAGRWRVALDEKQDREARTP
jgi:hypothetical protein